MNKLLADYEKKIVVPSGTMNTLATCMSSEEESEEDEEEDYGNARQYEQDFVNEEMKRYAMCSSESRYNERGDNEAMSEVDGVEGFDFRKNPLNVYACYNFTINFVRRELPIDCYRKIILDCINANPVVVIQGPTGCGKTTQVPQYILDFCREEQAYCNIVVTQPRKIATINVAKRVCEERGWTIGTVCGYQVGLEKRVSNDVLLTYMTTGVLLQKLISAKSLRQYTHIIIDEVHERNQELDFLLLVVRRFLFCNSPDTKIILMSATIDADEFSRYFTTNIDNITSPAPILVVNKQGEYRRSFFYLEQLDTLTSDSEIGPFDLDKPEIAEPMWKLFVQITMAINNLDEVDPETNTKKIGSILVFLPGIHEIEEANQQLINYFNSQPANDKTIKWEIIPLHSSLPNDEQARAFRPPKPAHRKIILSTNIAESSITVPDSCYVIDFCLTKVMTVDPITKYMSLKLEWASHVNCDQRAGRVGRTGSGRVYRLVPKSFYDEQMLQRGLPEILRAPLERIVLQSKMLNLSDSPRQILALAMNPPNMKNIEITILSLKEMGALLQTCRGQQSTTDGDITFLGTVMASLPIDVRLSKLIVLGYMFCCLDETIIIAAGCSVQNIFSIPFQQRFNAYKKLLLWADNSFSDLIALYNLFQVWQGLKRENKFESTQDERRWCTSNLVSLKGLKEWNLIVQEIVQRLDGLKIKSIPGQAPLHPDEKALLLKIIAAGAFYPNYFIRTTEATQITERDAVKTVGGHNPFKTIYFTGMEPQQPVPIYMGAIRDMLGYRSDAPNIVVGFDGSSKIYVEFKELNRIDPVTISNNGNLMVTDAVTGKIPKDVYEAIRKNQLKYNFKLRILPLKEAWKYAEANGIQRSLYTSNKVEEIDDFATCSGDISDDIKNCFSTEEFSPIPTLDTEWITIKISEFIDASHFWANRLESEIHLAKLDSILNKTVLHPAVGAIRIGKLYAARYEADNLFYRCSITSMAQGFAQIIFIDYGNIQRVQTRHLYDLPDLPECKMPPLAIECMLHGVQPSRKMNPRGLWNDRANDYWRKQTMNILLYGHVHSVVDNVVYLEIYRNQHVKSLNQHMLDTGQADRAADSFLSRTDHERRLKILNADNPNLESRRMTDPVRIYQDVQMPRISANSKTITLKGPFSPLEMKVYGCVESSASKSVSIEGMSVNTVLLDNEPEDYHTRLLVAGYVAQSMNSERLNLRQTTLMPNIPGLAMLMSLIFCHTMEVKVTDDGTRVASILCGLGHHPITGKAIYPSHDLSLTLDTELTEDEINAINRVRHYLNQALKLMFEIDQGTSSHLDMIQTQISLRKEVLNLIYAQRRTVERTNVKFDNVWGRNRMDLLMLKPQNMEGGEVWPLLWFVKLKQHVELGSDVPKLLNDLDVMSRQMVPFIEITCPICRDTLDSLYVLRMHLSSDEHRAAVQNYMESMEMSD